ncbi:sporulation delaying protein family toxin [Streptomyces gibsoniae]|uniref:Sporulation delaying protein family toxin n=1 Tax=Streptomyces gibsoniae TaxID=3075529 RepID=A0ABU2UAJ4_9ACTN|nr:sporulation delaying protein family toxin [Streptomyces sp. DSM 41699]MDT0470056.1 sporulation delaying protein family toxin [Streptomyces sp. DSM 41699]
MRLKKPLIGAVLTATMVTGVAGTASARTQAPHPAPVAAVQAAQGYSDSDVVAFLVFGQGKAAKDHPELARQIRSRRSDTSVTPAQLSYLMHKLHQADPAFHTKVTNAVQSKDPFVVQQGMVALNDDLKAAMASDSRAKTLNSADIARPNGWVWTKSNIVTVANVAAGINVAAGTNVAVGAEVAVVVVIAPAAASYSFDLKQSDQLDANDFVAAVASTL